jgi:hypothetical protein
MCKAGLVPNGGEWPQRCAFCLGRGSLSLERVCELIDEHPSTVRKLLRPNQRMRPKVAERILTNLHKLLYPKQPELFR